ncbi:hypothetical protein TBC1_1242 [Lentimicrobium saccharophilum]|uniref:Uncharacterized protein n=1 Tax=Lentimicrobium saccharophilum TaxID=1678841 RepID=A0A0S7C2D0_9BACT|nr:hypothetical protein TBC1_1242 [Lentimicrobium saccharophilum]
MKENLSGQVVDCCGLALRGSQELRETQQNPCGFASLRGESNLGWSRLVSATLDHRYRFTFERPAARASACRLRFWPGAPESSGDG